MKKLILLSTHLILWAVLCPFFLISFQSVTFAQTITIPSNLNNTESFDVGDILNVNDEQGTAIQGQEYLSEDSKTPLLSFILDTINFITRIIGVIAMGLIVIGGIRMIVSQGSEDQLQKGKALLETAIVGLVISMFSYIIVRFVQSIFYLQS
ncbi:MAG: hypothetical protein WC882_05250 [Candidatus Gracilibacteria bacterium]